MLGAWAQLPTQLSYHRVIITDLPCAWGLGSKAGQQAGRQAMNSEAAAALG